MVIFAFPGATAFTIPLAETDTTPFYWKKKPLSLVRRVPVEPLPQTYLRPPLSDTGIPPSLRGLHDASLGPASKYFHPILLVVCHKGIRAKSGNIVIQPFKIIVK